MAPDPARSRGINGRPAERGAGAAARRPGARRIRQRQRRCWGPAVGPGRSRRKGEIYSGPEVLETTNRYNENDGASKRVHELSFGIVIRVGFGDRLRHTGSSAAFQVHRVTSRARPCLPIVWAGPGWAAVSNGHSKTMW